MDEETRAGFDEMLRGLEAMRQEMRQGFTEINGRFGEVNGRFGEVNGRFDEVNGRFEEMNERFGRELRELGVLTEDLRSQIQAVAEGGRGNEQAIERLRLEMHERFRENEIVVGAAFRQIRRDIDELRDRR
jgi:predicted nuclease with TOPRIM domain